MDWPKWVRPILGRGAGAMEHTGPMDGQIMLLLPCIDPDLARDEVPSPWSWALGCSEAVRLGELQTDIVRCLGLEGLLWSHFTLGCGRPIHSQVPSHSVGKRHQISDPTCGSELGQYWLQTLLLCPIGCWKSPYTDTAQLFRVTCPIVQSSFHYVFVSYTWSVPAPGPFVQNILQCQMHLSSSSLYPLSIC